MIRVSSLNKYYNKGKVNENHVINNFSYVFEDTGLYSLFGRSGSGKTTLLNCIGLVDSFDSGDICFEGDYVTKYISKKCDEIRNEMIGYIYQNYNLIEDLNVTENIEVVLDMIGCFDKVERKKRIKNVLEAVGLYKHRRRNVNALSGGERQRVAIARALVKKPKVILADEPTGNLDSNNTFEIMNIIKKISKTNLVILVSHEKELVDFYSDYIIEISDGRMISDRMNVNKGSLKHNDPRNIYLSEFKKEEVSSDNIKMNVYSNEKTNNLSFEIIVKGSDVYVKGNTDLKIHYLDESSEIKIIDKSEEEYTKDISESESSFNLDGFDDSKLNSKNKLTSVIKSAIDSIKGGKYIRKKKFTRIGLAILSCIFAVIVLSIGSIFDIDKTVYTHCPDNVVSVDVNRIDNINHLYATDINSKLENDKDAIAIPFDETNKQYFVPNMNNFYQTNYYVDYYSLCRTYCFVEPIEYNTKDLILGSNPAKDNEIVIGKWMADNLLKCEDASINGYYEYDRLIGLEGTLYSQINTDYIYKIVGIVDEESPTIYFTKTSFDNLELKIESGTSTVYIITNNKENTIKCLESYNDVNDANEVAKTRYLLERFIEEKSNLLTIVVIAIVAAIYLGLLVRSGMFERIKEIGVIRSIGATKKDVRSIFVGEMIGITTTTSFISYTLMYLLITIYSVAFSLEGLGIKIFVSSIFSYIIGVILIYLLNIISCLIPVNNLLRKTPIEIIKKYDI